MMESKILEANMKIGYKMKLDKKDEIILNRKCYHGRVGGDLDQLHDSPMFFYPEGNLSSEFTIHRFINDDATYQIASACNSDEDFNNAYISLAPVIFICHITIENPIILDMAKLTEIANFLCFDNIDYFVSEFEDSNSEYRDLVFSLVKNQGYDGAIIVNDMTPEVAGGDWCFRTSYISFYPSQQVKIGFDDSTYHKFSHNL